MNGMDYFVALVPDPLFLLVAAGFQGVVMAIFVPVSLDIISKTSAKYDSDVIVRLYKKNFINRVFPYFLLTSTIGMIVTRFFLTPEMAVSVWGKAIMWSLLGSLIIITYMIGYLIYRMERFVSDDTAPLRILYVDLNKSITLKNTSSARRRLIETLSGIGDILTYQMRRQNNLTILDGLDRIGRTIDLLLKMKIQEPDRFASLVYDAEFLAYRKEASERALAQFCFANPDKYLAGFAAPVNQLMRIYTAALNAANVEVSRRSLRSIHLVLQSCVIEKDNALLVEWMLKKISESSNLAMRSGEETERLSFAWYVDLLFKEPHVGKGAFQLAYLELCDRYFARMATTIVTQGYDIHYRRLVDSVARDFVFPNYQRGKVWGYHYLLRVSNYEEYRRINFEYGIQRKVRRLLLTEHRVQTIDDLEAWKANFNELRDIIMPRLRDEYRREALRLEFSIISYVTAYFKYKRLVRFFYALGTHCELRERYDLMHYLWEAGRTAEGIYRLLPPSAPILINDYLTYPPALNRNYFGEAYQIMTIHRKRYYILFLAWLLVDERTTNYRLPALDLTQLGAIGAQMDEMIRLVGELKGESRQRTRLLWQLAFNRFGDLEQWEKRVVDFLMRVKRAAQKQLVAKQRTTEISPKHRDEFKSAILEGFNDQAILRALFQQHTNTYLDRAQDRVKTSAHGGWGIQELANKATFLELRELRSAGWNYGKNLADNENMFLFENILNHCQRITMRRFESGLTTAGDPGDVFILGSRFALEHFLAQSDNFHSHQLGELVSSKRNGMPKEVTAIPGFAGSYHSAEQAFPVFVFSHRGSGNQLLILNRRRLGAMVQLPMPAGGRKQVKLLGRIFHFDLRSLSASRPLVKRYLDMDVDWLRKLGDEKTKRDYLRRRVLVVIQQHLAFQRAEDFIGYKILIRARSLADEGAADFLI